MIPAPELPQIDHEAVSYIAAHMRASDLREIEATNWSMDGFADRVMLASEFAFFASHRGRPAAVIGALPMWPGVWSAFAFGTDDFQPCGARLTKFVRRFLIPGIWNAGGHRIECASIEGHDEAHAWLESFGAVRESEMPGYGRGGETFYRYVLRRMN